MLQTVKQRTIRFPHLRKLQGPHGLILAIIAMAMKDAIDPAAHCRPHRSDALAYFESDWYRHHLAALGLPGDWLPDGIERG
jgi:hypothetical protein